MTHFDKLKAEIAKMSIDDFMKYFVSQKDGAKSYICADIKHPQAHCTKTDDYSCMACLREHLRSDTNE